MSSNVATSIDSTINEDTKRVEENHLQQASQNLKEDITKDGNKVATDELSTETETTFNITTSESDDTTSDHEPSNSSSTTSSMHASGEERGNDIAEFRKMIAKGLAEIPNRLRTQIDEEVHGVKSMGLPQEEESKPHVKALFLKQFQDVLDCVLSASGSTGVLVSPDPTSSSSASLPPYPTAAYELCLRKSYTYATSESGELRLMCLRADMWNPAKACERFLKHLTAMYKYFGDDGLKQPLTIDQLDLEERRRSFAIGASPAPESRGIYKKGKGGSKRRGSLDTLPDMLALKSGSIQVLPSRDRSGRRVVILQPEAAISTSQKTKLQVQRSKFKAILYFLCALLRRDADAQRKGVVLILNSNKPDEVQNETEYNTDLLSEYKEICQSLPIRFSAIHFAFDKDSVNSVPNKICRMILRSFIEDSQGNNIARIHLYHHDVSNDNTKNKIAPFGIPIHQIPVTHTGTIKLKEHNTWIKIQEWHDKKMKSGPDHFNVIECPGTNDVLFSQGGKYWNGANRFQRGNLEFMEFLETKIDIYQATLSWKKKHSILAEAIAEFSAAPQSTGSPPRFLETATQIDGVMAPDGCWVELPLNSPLLMQKIRQTLLNHIRRLENSGKRKPLPSKTIRAKMNGTGEKQKRKKKNTKDTKCNIPNKKRKMSLDSSIRKTPQLHSPVQVIKNNKLAIDTFGSSIHTGSSTDYKIDDDFLAQKQSICELLSNAERIAVSAIARDIGGESNTAGDLTANDEKIVQAIIANDDRLNKEVEELFDLDFSTAFDSHIRNSDDDDRPQNDPIANDDEIVQAIIANDDQLNKEVGELFDIDSFLPVQDEEDSCEHGEMDDSLKQLQKLFPEKSIDNTLFSLLEAEAPVVGH